MPNQILTNEQQEIIRDRFADIDDWRDEQDLQLRHRISEEVQRVLQDSGVLGGKTIDHKTWSELIGLQWQIQNLNPMQMPKLLGYYHYKVHFVGYRGTEADLAAEKEEKTGDPKFYPGPDLDFVSQALRSIAGDSVEQHGLGATQLYKVDGAGQALVSGFLSLLHSDRYGIINQPTKYPFDVDGLLKVTNQQRKVAHEQAKATFPNASDMSRDALFRIFRWEVFLKEVSQLCDLPDFLELDQFLWSLSSELDVQQTKDRLEKIMADDRPQDLRIRRQAEQEAREIITANLGQLSEQDFRNLFEKLNTCLGKKGISYTRFGPAFVGHNVNQLLSNLDEINRSTADLWRATDDEAANVLTRFWDANFPGSGRIFPTAILYLKDNEKYAVWTNKLEKALYSVIRGLPAKFKTGFSYLQYSKGVQQLRKKWGFAPEMHDYVLLKLMKPTATKPSPVKIGKTSGTFQGFDLDTFQFMKELVQNNTQDWFDTNRKRFKTSVDKPLRALVKDVGEHVITQLNPELETTANSNKCLSRIRKNIYGKATENTYHDIYWAAYYRKDRKKQTDCQLFLAIWPDRFTHGFYIPDGADDLRKGLVSVLEEHVELGSQVFEQLKKADFLFAEGVTDANRNSLEINDYQAFVELVKNHRFHVFRRWAPEEAQSESSQLREKVGEDFRLLYSLFLLATSAHPEVDVPPLLEGAEPDEEDDDDEITIADLYEKTFLEEEFFEDLDRYLEDKQQLIFCGPPGTSKTFVALEYADYLAQGGGEVRTVQFHPSYGYEDFIEGLRPVASDNGSLTYSVEDGIFKRLCDAARTSPKQTFVLIVDEINRGNIPRIFGELLFLLERREKKVELPYSKKSFSIPRNVVVLGTMNSSDRSIALMDLALRRRFHFVKMEPRSDILLAWLRSHNKPVSIHSLLESLNVSLSKLGIETDRLIGHAHFMSPLLDEDFLELVWRGTVMPLLEEYFIAEPEKLAEFQLEKLLEVESADEEEEDIAEDEIEDASEQDEPKLESPQVTE